MKYLNRKERRRLEKDNKFKISQGGKDSLEFGRELKRQYLQKMKNDEISKQNQSNDEELVNFYPQHESGYSSFGGFLNSKNWHNLD